jgi:hypothetical protein
MELLSLIPMLLKALPLAIAGLLALLWKWEKGKRKQAEAERDAYAKVEEVRKADVKVDRETKAQVEKVDATPDSGLDAELDRVFNYAESRNAKVREANDQ